MDAELKEMIYEINAYLGGSLILREYEEDGEFTFNELYNLVGPCRDSTEVELVDEGIDIKSEEHTLEFYVLKYKDKFIKFYGYHSSWSDTRYVCAKLVSRKEVTIIVWE